ncbi:MAG: hypothetical protein HY901_13000, partial [Deltaproteobacteria bacterium]|nr:hypothetical protein [Deltaproteobacteria bacterium]
SSDPVCRRLFRTLLDAQSTSPAAHFSTLDAIGEVAAGGHCVDDAILEAILRTDPALGTALVAELSVRRPGLVGPLARKAVEVALSATRSPRIVDQLRTAGERRTAR